MKYKKGKLWKIPTLVVCAVLFGLLAADISGSYVTAPIDVAAYHILRSFESSAATGFFKIMTNMVHPVVLLVISLSMIHILKITGKKLQERKMTSKTESKNLQMQVPRCQTD